METLDTYAPYLCETLQGGRLNVCTWLSVDSHSRRAEAISHAEPQVERAVGMVCKCIRRMLWNFGHFDQPSH